MRFLAAGFVYLLLVAFALGIRLAVSQWDHDLSLVLFGVGLAVAYGGARDSWNSYGN